MSPRKLLEEYIESKTRQNFEDFAGLTSTPKRFQKSSENFPSSEGSSIAKQSSSPGINRAGISSPLQSKGDSGSLGFHKRSASSPLLHPGRLGHHESLLKCVNAGVTNGAALPILQSPLLRLARQHCLSQATARSNRAARLAPRQHAHSFVNITALPSTPSPSLLHSNKIRERKQRYKGSKKQPSLPTLQQENSTFDSMRISNSINEIPSSIEESSSSASCEKLFGTHSCHGNDSNDSELFGKRNIRPLSAEYPSKLLASHSSLIGFHLKSDSPPTSSSPIHGRGSGSSAPFISTLPPIASSPLPPPSPNNSNSPCLPSSPLLGLRTPAVGSSYGNTLCPPPSCSPGTQRHNSNQNFLSQNPVIQVSSSSDTSDTSIPILTSTIVTTSTDENNSVRETESKNWYTVSLRTPKLSQSDINSFSSECTKDPTGPDVPFIPCTSSSISIASSTISVYTSPTLLVSNLDANLISSSSHPMPTVNKKSYVSDTAPCIEDKTMRDSSVFYVINSCKDDFQSINEKYDQNVINISPLVIPIVSHEESSCISNSSPSLYSGALEKEHKKIAHVQQVENGYQSISEINHLTSGESYKSRKQFHQKFSFYGKNDLFNVDQCEKNLLNTSYFSEEDDNASVVSCTAVAEITVDTPGNRDSTVARCHCGVCAWCCNNTTQCHSSEDTVRTKLLSSTTAVLDFSSSKNSNISNISKLESSQVNKLDDSVDSGFCTKSTSASSVKVSCSPKASLSKIARREKYAAFQKSKERISAFQKNLQPFEAPALGSTASINLGILSTPPIAHKPLGGVLKSTTTHQIEVLNNTPDNHSSGGDTRAPTAAPNTFSTTASTTNTIASTTRALERGSGDCPGFPVVRVSSGIITSPAMVGRARASVIHTVSSSSPILHNRFPPYSSPVFQHKFSPYSSPLLQSKASPYSSPLLQSKISPYSSPLLQSKVTPYSSPLFQNKLTQNSSSVFQNKCIPSFTRATSIRTSPHFRRSNANYSKYIQPVTSCCVTMSAASEIYPSVVSSDQLAATVDASASSSVLCVGDCNKLGVAPAAGGVSHRPGGGVETNVLVPVSNALLSSSRSSPATLSSSSTGASCRDELPSSMSAARSASYLGVTGPGTLDSNINVTFVNNTNHHNNNNNNHHHGNDNTDNNNGVQL